MLHEVWVTGIGIVTALGEGMASHTRAVLEGASGLSPRDFFGGASPDPVICGAVPASVLAAGIEEAPGDRADRLLRLAMQAAIADARLVGPVCADVIAGVTLGNMHGATRYHRQIRRAARPDVSLVNGFILASPLSRVCGGLGIRGRTLTISSACGSATAALGEAFRSIRAGATRRVIAGGFETLSPYVVAGFNSLRLISKEICRPFDCRRQGINPAEGAAMLVCESAAEARSRGARPLARIAGFGAALDAYHYTRAHPEGKGLALALHEAISSAGMTPADIDHLHLHGTGTDANDPSEYSACAGVFGSLLSRIPACSTKPLTGHTFGASGAINAVLSIISIREKTIPGTISLSEQDPNFAQLNLAPQARKSARLATSLSLSLGFGGEASALILAEASE